MMLFANGLATSSYAQAASFLIPADSLSNLNTTDPANLSWVVGRFEIQEISNDSARLRPTSIGLLPEFKTHFDRLKFILKQGDTLNITIRGGNISSIK